MPFQKKNDLGFKPKGEEKLDPKALQVKVKPGIRERLKQIPNWQDRMREKIAQWLEEWESEKCGQNE